MKILLGVTGGIACYKATEIVRAFQERGADVQVVMTRSAQEFIQPLTFASLTGKRVLTSLWDDSLQQGDSAHDGPIEHIAVAQEIDAFVIAPATANTLAQLAHGMAGDYLTTVFLATRAPVIVAPAMNVNMWEHPATQANIERLQKRGVRVVAPASGYLACGMQGGGRLADAQEIVEATMQSAQGKHDLEGETIVVTAGGTREAIDPVRYLGNRSSGKMGHALAEAAAQRGARVILITTASLPTSSGIEIQRVSTAQEMERAVFNQLPKTSILIMAAAVADFRPKEFSASKIRRAGNLMLELEPTKDIVAEAVSQRRDGTLIIAFAAETESLEENARAKLQRKGVDAIVANDVSSTETGFDSDYNAGIFLTPTQSVQLHPATKYTFAQRVLDEIARLRTSNR